MAEPAAPANIVKWVNENHPRPAVDPVWLRDCCSWIADSYSLSPTSITEFSSHVISQFYQSSLADSTLQNTGLPQNIHAIKRARLSGPPCLVEIRAISDIAQSAFSLMNVRQNRMDRADLAGLVGEGEEDAEEDEGPVPRYPRGMLRLELSDGFTTVEAVEYRSIPQLELGVTPLGYKILLKGVQIRRGILFLEPKTIELKGHQTEDHEAMQDEIFLRSLRRRLGKPDPDPNPQPAGEVEAPMQAPPPPRAPSPPLANRRPVGNSPKASTSANAASTAVRSKPVSTAAPKPSSALAASKSSSIPASTSSTLVSSSKPTSSLKPPPSANHSAPTTSPYFSTSSTLSSSNPSTLTSGRSGPHDNLSAPLARARILSPAPRDTMWSLDDEEFEALVTESGPAPVSPPKPISKLPSKRNASSTRPAASPPRPPSPPSDYDLNLMDLDDDLLAQVEKMEAEALAVATKPSSAKGSNSDMRDMIQMNASRATGPRHQGIQGITGAMRMTSGSSRPSTVPISSATTARPRSGPSSAQSQPQNSTHQRRVAGPVSTRRQHVPSTSREDFINIDSDDDMYVDDSDDGKENVPFSTQTQAVVDEDVIEISD